MKSCCLPLGVLLTLWLIWRTDSDGTGVLTGVAAVSSLLLLNGIVTGLVRWVLPDGRLKESLTRLR